MDVDEDAYRDGRLADPAVRLPARAPSDARLVQAGKVRSRSEDAAADQLAASVADGLEPGVTYVLGPGTTTRRIARRLGFEGTLLGVDVVRDGRLVAADVGERAMLDRARSRTRRHGSSSRRSADRATCSAAATSRSAHGWSVPWAGNA